MKRQAFSLISMLGLLLMAGSAVAQTIHVRADVHHGKVRHVTFENVPAFAVHLDKVIEVPHLGAVNVDVAFGGMFYVIAEAAPLGLSLTPDEGHDIVRIGEMVKAAAHEQLLVAHPENPEIQGITIAELTGPPTNPNAIAKNAVIVSTGQLDWNRPAIEFYEKLGATFLNERRAVTFESEALKRMSEIGSPQGHRDTEKIRLSWVCIRARLQACRTAPLIKPL